MSSAAAGAGAPSSAASASAAAAAAPAAARREPLVIGDDATYPLASFSIPPQYTVSGISSPESGAIFGNLLLWRQSA